MYTTLKFYHGRARPCYPDSTRERHQPGGVFETFQKYVPSGAKTNETDPSSGKCGLPPKRLRGDGALEARCGRLGLSTHGSRHAARWPGLIRGCMAVTPVTTMQPLQ